MATRTLAAPFRTAESLMAMSGIGLAGVGAAVMGLVLASDADKGVGDWHFAWQAPAITLAFLLPAAAGAALMPQRAWTGGALVMANAALLAVGAIAASSVLVPLGLVYLPAAVLLWRSGSRAVARRGAEEIVSGPRPYAVWAAGGAAGILAFLLIASHLYEACAVVGGRLSCQPRSLGDETLVLALAAGAIAVLLAAGGLLLASRPPRPGALWGRWPAALPGAAAVLGLGGLASSLAVIAFLALALLAISIALFFLPTETKAER